jgi:hypothetical protein
VAGGSSIRTPAIGQLRVNVKYLKNGKAQDRSYIEHRPDGDYKVKSTAPNASGGFAIIQVTGATKPRSPARQTMW